jgi:hypothetical protein
MALFVDYSCKQASRILSDAQDHPLAFGERISLRWHLWQCTNCTHYRQQLQVLRELMGELGSEAPPGDTKGNS